MSRRSWMWMCVAALAVAACGPPSADLSPQKAAVPEAPYGLVVGVAAVARTPGTPPSANSAVDAFMIYRQPYGVSGELLLAAFSVFLHPDVYKGVEDGLTVYYRPFALKLSAAPTELVSFNTRWLAPEPKQVSRTVVRTYKDHQGQTRTRVRTETVTEQDWVPVVRATSLPGTSFEVVAGKARYIGRVGMVVHAEQPLDAPCVRGKREGMVSFSPSYCLIRAPFMENRQAADLAMIRQHFPGLAGIEIEVRPLEAAPGSWQTLAEAAHPFTGGHP